MQPNNLRHTRVYPYIYIQTYTHTNTHTHTDTHAHTYVYIWINLYKERSVISIYIERAINIASNRIGIYVYRFWKRMAETLLLLRRYVSYVYFLTTEQQQQSENVHCQIVISVRNPTFKPGAFSWLLIALTNRSPSSPTIFMIPLFPFFPVIIINSYRASNPIIVIYFSLNEAR